MVIPLDSDPVKRMSKFLPNFTLQRVLQTCSDYLIKVLHNVLVTHKNSLPTKAQNYRYPSILWVVPPTHRNFNDNKGRKILASVLERSVMKFNEMPFICLKNWDFNNGELVHISTSGYRLTNRGLMRYWISIDEALRSWDSGSTTFQHSRPGGKCWPGHKPHFDRKQ